MFELIGIAVVIWVVWKIIKAIARTATTQAYHQGAAESLDLATAQKQFEDAEADFIGSVFIPGGVSATEQQSMLDKATFLKDRINQLTGGETGSAFRARYRNELIAKANNFGPSIQAGFEAYQREKEQETEQGHGYESFEDWLEEFKDGAGSADEHLATTTEDGTSLIDLMDLTPLHRAFAEGVEPYELGVEFGEQFDIGEFLARNHKGAT